MTSRRLVYETPEGGCRIIKPIKDRPLEWEEEVLGLARIAHYALENRTAVELLWISEDQIPNDYTFREAWKKGDKYEPIKIDLQKCTAIHRSRLEGAASKKIGQLNVQLEIALENNNTPEAVSIRATKKILRTIHEMNLTHCKTADDVKWAIPKELMDAWDYYEIPANRR